MKRLILKDKFGILSLLSNMKYVYVMMVHSKFTRLKTGLPTVNIWTPK